MRRANCCSLAHWLAVMVLLVTVVSIGGQEEERQRIMGKLLDFRAQQLLIQDRETKEKIALGFDERTRLRVSGLGQSSLVRPGMVIEVEGNVHPETYVIQAKRVSLWLDGSGPTVNTNGGAYYTLEADRATGVVPVVISGEVIGVKPMRMRGGNSLFSRYYFSDEVDESNQPRDVHEFPSIGKEFRVDHDESNPVMVELGRNLSLAGPNAHVTAYVRPRDQFLDSVYLTREEPVTDELLGLVNEKGKKKGRRGRGSTVELAEEGKDKGAEVAEDEKEGRVSARQSAKQRAAEKQFQLGLAKLKAGKREEAERFFAKARRLDESAELASKIDEVMKEEEPTAAGE